MIAGKKEAAAIYEKVKTPLVESKAQELQLSIDINDMRILFWPENYVWTSKVRCNKVNIKKSDLVLGDKSEISDPFADHFDSLLNVSETLDRTIQPWPHVPKYIAETKQAKLCKRNDMAS